MHWRLKQLLGTLTRPLEPLTGPAQSWLRHREAISAQPSITRALRTLAERWPALADEAPDDTPVFLLASSWRSGSTLLQRLILSGDQALLWGEPYAHSSYIQDLAASLQVFTPRYPLENFFARDLAPGLAEQWVANLYPPPQHLLAAHRAFFQTLYGAPATAAGYRRWGLKEVRLSVDHAHYLRFLFPRAQFVFLIRNPYDAYRSYRSWRSWYDRWPSAPVFTPRAFGRHWLRLSTGFVKRAEEVGGIVVRYEELALPETLQRLSEYLSVRVDPDVFGTRQRGKRAAAESVPRSELALLRRAVAPLASELHYHALSADREASGVQVSAS